MLIPSLEEAQAYLREAETRNPGPWVKHSEFVAKGAAAIAKRHPNLSPESAQILGLLHDIGRREGITGMRHIWDGFKFMQAEGYPDAARICLTHSFPIQNVEAGSAIWDLEEAEILKVKLELHKVEYDDYDCLIQLCDSLALPEGFCLIEKRLVDVLIRYENYNVFTLPKWREIFNIRREFEKVIGASIYDLLPGVKEVSFR